MTRRIVVLIVLVAACVAVRADDKDPVKEKLFAAKVAYDAEMQQFRKQAGDWFDKREEDARNDSKNNKKLVDQVKAEQKVFDETGELPKGAPPALKQKPTAAKKSLEAAYGQAVKEYTKSKKDTEAAAVEAEWKVFVKGNSSARTDDAKPPAGFTALFNGKDLDGWQGNIDMKQRATLPKEKQDELVKQRTKTALEHWSVKDGVIHCDGKGGISLQTAKDYGNFELMVDWKIEKNGDSGLYLRGQPQVQIWDSENTPGARNEDKNTGSGGLWNNPLPADAAKSTDNAVKLKAGQQIGKIPLKKADKPVGEWNTFHITVIGDDVTVKLNGELVVEKAKLLNFWDRSKPVPETGPVELQFHGDPLWFKNIYIKELK